MVAWNPEGSPARALEYALSSVASRSKVQFDQYQEVKSNKGKKINQTENSFHEALGSRGREESSDFSYDVKARVSIARLGGVSK